MRSAIQRLSVVLCVFALVAGCRKKGPETVFKLDNGLRVELAPSPDGDQVALVVLRGGDIHTLEVVLTARPES